MPSYTWNFLAHDVHHSCSSGKGLINIPFYPHPVLTSQMTPVKRDAVGVRNMH